MKRLRYVLVLLSLGVVILILSSWPVRVSSPANSAGSQVALAAAPRDAGADTELAALLRAQAKAWNRGDIEAFMAGYWKSDRTTFAGTDGVFRGWQALFDRYRRNYSDRAAMGRLAFTDLEITPLGTDAAMILGHWELEREKDRPGGIFTLVARRFPEGWRIIHDHTSMAPPPSRANP
jgi:ketosteroid isomerase-like protein